jgi:hypothetical protein
MIKCSLLSTYLRMYPKISTSKLFKNGFAKFPFLQTTFKSKRLSKELDAFAYIDIDCRLGLAAQRSCNDFYGIHIFSKSERCLMSATFQKGDAVSTMGAERVVQGESPNTRKYTAESWLRSLAATEGTTRYQDSDTTSIGGFQSIAFSIQDRRTASTWTSIYDSESDSELPEIKLPARRIDRSQPQEWYALVGTEENYHRKSTVDNSQKRDHGEEKCLCLSPNSTS